MPNVIVTHLDLSTTVYPNCMAGCSNNQGSGWKLSVIPTDSSQPPFVVDLRSGDTYQVAGSLPDAASFAAPAQAAAPSAEDASAATSADAVLIKNLLPPATTDTVTAPTGVPDPIL